MTPTPLRLLDWTVPPVRHHYTRRDVAFYALSLGAGAHALDSRQLALVDPWHPALKALPSFALVVGYPGFWLGEPEVVDATGVPPWQILHGSQTVALAGPLPLEATVLGETRVVALVDKGSNRGSVLHSERKLFHEGTGDLIATCQQAHFLRCAGGFGSAGKPPAMISPMPLNTAPSHVVDIPTLPQQALLYRLNGDSNPLHADPELAARAGFPRPILHGLCTVGMVVTGVLGTLADFDPHWARGFSVRMTSPVLPGDTLRTEIWRDGSFRVRAMERDSVVLNDGWVELASIQSSGWPCQGGRT